MDRDEGNDKKEFVMENRNISFWRMLTGGGWGVAILFAFIQAFGTVTPTDKFFIGFFVAIAAVFTGVYIYFTRLELPPVEEEEEQSRNRG